MSIKQLIKDAAKESCKFSSQPYPQSEKKFEQGALWAMRWCLERWEQYQQSASGTLVGRVEAELDAAAKEILEGGK